MQVLLSFIQYSSLPSFIALAVLSSLSGWIARGITSSATLSGIAFFRTLGRWMFTFRAYVANDTNKAESDLETTPSV